MFKSADVSADLSEVSLWYRTDAWEGPWRVEIWAYWNELEGGRPVKILGGVADGGGEGGSLIADDHWHQARGPLVATPRYETAPENTLLGTYVWLSPVDGWDVPHRTYVDRIELSVLKDDPEQRRPAPEPVWHIRPNPGEQVTGDGWVWWEAEDAVEHNFPPGACSGPTRRNSRKNCRTAPGCSIPTAPVARRAGM